MEGAPGFVPGLGHGRRGGAPQNGGAGASAVLVPGQAPHRPGTHLYMLGEVQAAHDLEQDTLDRRRRILGRRPTHTCYPLASSPTTCALAKQTIYRETRFPPRTLLRDRLDLMRLHSAAQEPRRATPSSWRIAVT